MSNWKAALRPLIELKRETVVLLIVGFCFGVMFGFISLWLSLHLQGGVLK